MNCPKCQGKTQIRESRKGLYGTRRRHYCLSCDYKFSTTEIETSEYKRLKALEKKFEMVCGMVSGLNLFLSIPQTLPQTEKGGAN